MTRRVIGPRWNKFWQRKTRDWRSSNRRLLDWKKWSQWLRNWRGKCLDWKKRNCNKNCLSKNWKKKEKPVLLLEKIRWEGASLFPRTCRELRASDPSLNSGMHWIDPARASETCLNFGRTQLASLSGIHMLGRFECTGQVAVVGRPKSCADLWRIGPSLSGSYSVIEAK